MQPKIRRTLTEEEKQALRLKTVEVLLELRAAYLAAGANPLKHWEQLTDRMRACARTTTSVEEWVTAMQRALGLGAPSSGMSQKLVTLNDEVTALHAVSDWLDLLEREFGYLIALARLEAEDRREQRQRLAAVTTTPTEGGT